MATDAGLTAAHPVTAKPRRRWFQYSLRTLLVLMLVFGAGLGWFAHKVQQAREQREAVKAIEKLGCYVCNQPAWLGALLGADLFADATDVFFWGDQLTDGALEQGLEHLKGLPQLHRVLLLHTQVTDAGLRPLRGLTQLRTLGLGGAPVTDAGLEHLEGLTQLERLELGGTPVTDAGLEHLQGLTQLQVLDLMGTKVTGAGVQKLQKAIPNLTMLR